MHHGCKEKNHYLSRKSSAPLECNGVPPSSVRICPVDLVLRDSMSLVPSNPDYQGWCLTVHPRPLTWGNDGNLGQPIFIWVAGSRIQYMMIVDTVLHKMPLVPPDETTDMSSIFQCRHCLCMSCVRPLESYFKRAPSGRFPHAEHIFPPRLMTALFTTVFFPDMPSSDLL